MKKTIEELLQSPYWIIDILPSQVPKDSPGQYFAVEKVFLQGDRIEEIKQKHIDLIWKLNCYRDISRMRSSQKRKSGRWTQAGERSGPSAR